MSKLDELIQQHCPDGVEYKKLGEVLSVNRGRRLTKVQLSEDGQYYVYHGSKDTPLGKYSQFNVKGNTTIVVNTGGIGGVKFCDNDFWCSDGSFWIGHSDLFNDKFVYYYLSPLEPYFASQKRVGGVPTIDRSVVENVEIPIPPLPVQEEIVRILDTFTELQAELQAELQKRLQQYEYYRDKLLSFSDLSNWGGQEVSVEWKKLGDICNLSRGKVYSKSYIEENAGEYPVYSSQTANNGELGRISTYDYDGEYLTWTTDGAYAGTIFYRKGKFSITNVCGLISIKGDNLLIKFLFYWLSIKAPDYVYRGMGNPKLMSNQMEPIKVPIIPLAEQQRIVDILDRFNTLTTDITAGLPAEIEARRKQYEYYRDQLLTFKQKA